MFADVMTTQRALEQGGTYIQFSQGALWLGCGVEAERERMQHMLPWNPQKISPSKFHKLDLTCNVTALRSGAFVHCNLSTQEVEAVRSLS